MDNILSKLEYMQIIQIIERYCKTYLGKKQCLSCKPSFIHENVENSLTETNQAMALIVQKGALPLFEISEIEKHIKILESEQVLSIKALLDISKLLMMCFKLHTYFYEDNNFELSSFSALDKYFSQLYSNSSIEQSISSKIIDENTLSDNASLKLASLRKNRKNLEFQVKDKLNSYIHSSTYAKYIMEPIVTIRNNRYVIPVKEEYKDKIKGFVHDISSSGSTLYIEPMAIFELNNQINHFKMEENLEIEKILQILSDSLYPYVKELYKNLYLIGFIDFLFAKATYGINENGIIPYLNQEKIIDLHLAKHPLIDKKLVVPIDICLGKTYECLLITGPNTGGKTVALKTIGLLLLMSYSGIPVPCSEKTSIYVFSRFFVDIGDEQSIEQSLSTFSAHMTNLVDITNEANNNSLVLLDELGSGTDPIEGSALAISILSYLKEKGAIVCSTTHYSKLKEFALITEGFENASFEFDLENLKPTYRLLLGIPGKSNAFEISKKLGLETKILENASSFLKEDTISMEELLKNIYDNKLTIEKEKLEIEKNLNQIIILRQTLEHEQNTFSEKKKVLLEKAKSEARDLILESKEEVNCILKDLQENKNIKHANKARNKLNEKLKDFSPNCDLLEDSPHSIIAKDVKEGLEVWIPSLQTSGRILSSHMSKSEEVIVQVGTAKMNLKLKQLSAITQTSKNNFSKDSLTTIAVATSNNTNNFNSSVHVHSISKAQFVSPEINVIGQNVEEAIYVIDKYIDNCSLAHISPIRIVHGKGTGKLREGIHSYLKKNTHVKSFRLGTFGEGEMGVTIVELI